MKLESINFRGYVPNQYYGQELWDDKNQEHKSKPVSVTNKQEINGEYLKDAINYTNRAVRIIDYHIEFRLYKESGDYQVKVVNNDTGEVLRTIPNDAMMEIAAKIKQRLQESIGIVVDEFV